MRKTFTRGLMAGALVVSFGAGIGAHAMWSHPALLDSAIANLVGVQALLPGAETQLPVDFSGKNRKTYDKYFERAMQLTQDTIDAIAKMIEAAEGG
jgi:hypothetical protein